jgi:hypothetical protein
MVVEITQIGIETLQWKFYIIWTVLNGSFVPFTYFLYPETAGRTLEDIDHYFRKQPGLLVFRDKVRITLLYHKKRLLTVATAGHSIYTSTGVHRKGGTGGSSPERRQSSRRKFGFAPSSLQPNAGVWSWWGEHLGGQTVD